MTDSDDAPEDEAASSSDNAKEDESRPSPKWAFSTKDGGNSSGSHVDAARGTYGSGAAGLTVEDFAKQLQFLESSLHKNSYDEASNRAEELHDLATILANDKHISSSLYDDTIELLEEIGTKIDGGGISSADLRRLVERVRNLRRQLSPPDEEYPIREPVQEYIEKLEQKEKTIDQQQDQLQELEERLDKKENELEQVFEEVSDRRDLIEDSLSKAKDLKDERSQLAQWEVGEAIGGQFKKRKDELSKSLSFWLKGSLASIAVLLVFSSMLYADISSGSSQGTTVLSKVTLLLPVSVLVWFFVSNYSRQKRLMREYEFKETMAVSFRGSLEIVRDEMADEEGPHVGEFVVNTIDRIYSNPQENVSQSEESGNQNQSQNGPLSQGAVAEILNRLGNK